MDNTIGGGTGASFWAMLVGIDRYKTQDDLRGCVNDVEAMQILLANRYNVPEEHIRVLTDEEATRANILEAFQEFLIENSDIQRGDQILFHYSGHGSQMPAAPEDYEPDNLNETIVPHDSRSEGVFDIPDKTLAAILDHLAATKGDQITVILDSCHSGSGARRPEDPSGPRVRRLPADDRVPPAELDAELRAKTRAPSRAAQASGWALADMPYVLLAGCRDREESNEYRGKVEGSEAWHGALTFFTMQELRNLPAGTSYAELHERVAPLVNAEYPSQMPQCEGARDRQIFGSLRVHRDPFIPVREVGEDGRVVTLGAGLVHGLRPGTKLALYPPEVRTKADLPTTPLATVEVKSVAATTAQADVEGTPVSPIPQRARGVITEQVYAGLRQTVSLEPVEGVEHAEAADRLRWAIEHAADDKASPYLIIEDDPHAPVDLRVRVEEEQFWVYNDKGELLVDPEPIAQGNATNSQASAEKTLRALESIVRFRTVLELSNEDPGSQLDGKVKLSLRRYVEEPTGTRAEELPPGTIGTGGELTLYFDPDHEERNLYVVDVVNESERDVYPYVFTLSADYSISRLHPRAGIQDAVRPNKNADPYPIGLRRGTNALEFYLPPGWDASRDYLKVIVTTEETDLRLLEQGGLDVPSPRSTRGTSVGSEPQSKIEMLLEAVAFGERTRHARRRESFTKEDWTVAQLNINVVRKYQTAKLESPQGRVALSNELTLVKPEGFTGEITVAALDQATRGVEGDPSLKPPPGLERFPDLFEPVGRSPGTRGIGPGGLVVALDVDEQSRVRITRNNPLRLEVSTANGEEVADLVPVIFDGEDYLLAGYGTEDGTAAEVVSLPPPAGIPAADDQPAARGIGRALRLFIYKKMGRYTGDTGLRSAKLQDGEAVYEDFKRDSLRPGQRVAIFVHDFGSDSSWMVEKLTPFLREEVWSYDHLLTWDYETLGTSIEDSGEQLALALKQRCGLSPGDDTAVDVYAHGMGAIVSRCMIELSGGHAFVDRLVLAGPPNRGSTLISTGEGLFFVLTALLNFASPIPILGPALDMLKQLYQQGAGVADLATDSEVLKKLNALEEPTNVPYLVLAGDNPLEEEGKSRLNRIARKVLDKGLDVVFGEQNDLVVGLSSMRDLRGGAYSNLKVEASPCDHFHYYVIPEGRQAIKGWATDNNRR